MREFLKGLDLDKETIDTIMAEHGKLITEAKEEIMSLKNQVSDFGKEKESYEEKLKSYDEQLKNLQSVTDENKNLKNEIQMNGSNVKKEFMKFVTSEVSSQVNDDTDFATALENYKKENPQYFGDTVVKKVQSSPTLTGGSQPVSTNDIMNDILRSATKN